MKHTCLRTAAVVTAAAVMGAGRTAAGTHTWTGAVSTDWTAGGNWDSGVPADGDDVVIPAGTPFAPAIPAGTNPVSGAYSSFTVASGATATCLGDPTAVNEPSGGTAARPHGIGVTVFADTATINGTLSAFGKGFPAGGGPGCGYDGSAHGGKGGNSASPVYGSLTQPTALGSGSAAPSAVRRGGGAIRLAIGGTLSLNGTIDASAADDDRSGSGGSVWLSASTFSGSGVIKAEGGCSQQYNYPGGGGRVALEYTNSTFNGSVSVAGGKFKTTYSGQPGTLWEPGRFAGMAGAPDAPQPVLITNSYQYYFPDAATNHWNLTVSNAWFEPHQGALMIPNLTAHHGAVGFDRYADNLRNQTDMYAIDITNRIQVTGYSMVNLLAGTYLLPGGLFVGGGSVLGIRGNTGDINAASGGTVGTPHGSGVTIYTPSAVIDGTINAVGGGFGGNAGPGYGYDGAAHGGKGGTFASPVYGSLTQPTALGSGSQSRGGGAIRLVVGDSLSLNGTIDASAEIGARSGSGGSVWLSASTFSGSGVIKAEGGCNQNNNYPGGGGRVALEYTNSTFNGSVSVAGGKFKTDYSGQPGTLWEPKRFAGMAGAPDAPLPVLIASSYRYYFPDTTVNHWNLTVSNAWFEPHQGALQCASLTLTNACFRFDRYADGQPAVADMASFEIADDLRVTGLSKLYLCPRAYHLDGDLCVGPTANALVYPLGDVGDVNPGSGGTPGKPHGSGVALYCANACIDGTINAVGAGFGGNAGPGYGYDGAAHGGKGGTFASPVYGSLTQPTALGSGSQSRGGGAIRLVVDGTLSLNGTVDASAEIGTRSGSGGSVWITALHFAGTGAIKAEGTCDTKHNYPGGGGRVALEYTNSTFNGSVSVAGGKFKTDYSGQPGTLWEPKRFAGMAGAPDAPLPVLIASSYQYHFPGAATNHWNLTVSNAWFEPHQGALRLGNLTLTNACFRFDRYADGQPAVADMAFFDVTDNLCVAGLSKLYLCPRAYHLAGDFYLGPTVDALLVPMGDAANVNPGSRGTGAKPHGSGVTLRCANAAVAGWIKADARGFAGATGPGSPGNVAAAAGHGGDGGKSGKSYGALSRPTALGSGGASSRTGGGAFRLIADHTITVDGKITADAAGTDAYTGAGGSVWLVADTLAGKGALAAKGGNCSGSYVSGGGGRIALFAAHHDFTGSVSVAPGTVNGAAAPGKTGTLFRCTSPVPDCGAADGAGPQLISDFAVGSNAVCVTRTVTRWDRSFAWTDESRDPGGNPVNNAATYALRGLPPAVSYDIFTNGALAVAGAVSGDTGTLPLGVVPLTPGAAVFVDRVPTGMMILLR